MGRRTEGAGSAASRAIRRAIGLGVAAGAATLAAAGCAGAAAYNPSHLAEPDRASVAGLCEAVMGVSRSTARFDACMEGLSASVVDVGRGRDLARAREDCMGRGLLQGSAALAECELREKDAPLARPVLAGEPGAEAPTLRAVPYWAVPYWAASNADIHRREELSCARLGLEPVDAPFAACVANLDAALFAADNPAH